MSHNISAYILAGGKSKRMGEDKGLTLLHGKPLVSYIIKEIEKVTDDITLITSNRDYEKFNLRIIQDDYREMGPAAGIDKALHDAEHDSVFITSCDMPFVKAVSVLALIERRTTGQITLIRNENYIEPMFAIYQRECKSKWRELLLANTLKLSDYFSHFDTNFVNADEFLDLNPHLFFNVNTPQDLLNAAIWIKE